MEKTESESRANKLNFSAGRNEKMNNMSA